MRNQHIQGPRVAAAESSQVSSGGSWGGFCMGLADGNSMDVAALGIHRGAAQGRDGVTAPTAGAALHE